MVIIWLLSLMLFLLFIMIIIKENKKPEHFSNKRSVLVFSTLQ